MRRIQILHLLKVMEGLHMQFVAEGRRECGKSSKIIRIDVLLEFEIVS